MSAVAPGNSTVSYIRQKIRKLTTSPSESALTTAKIDEYINNFYLNDFPYGIKLDQMRSVYTFYTRPYIDRYPLDVNYNQGVRSPFYVDGIQGTFFKDRQQFYNIWPKFPTRFQAPSISSATITAATQANPCQITTTSNGFVTGDTVYIYNVSGMTQLNGNTYTITVINSTTFTLNGINSSAYTAYVSGGTCIKLNYGFNIPGPFLSNTVTFGSTSIAGTAISISDDGNGNLYSRVPNVQTSVPAANQNPGVPGMPNQNTNNPGLISSTLIGSVDYVTGDFSVNFSLASLVPDPSVQFTLWVSQYQTGKPYSLLFWNNEFTIRPVPKLIHRIEIETYLTPVQFMLSTDNPIINQWAKYIAYGASIDILFDRNDLDGVGILKPMLEKQEALVLERQGVEELFVPNVTLFNSSQRYTINGGWSQGAYF